MERCGAVDRGYGVLRACPLRHHFLELVDVAADRRNPVCIKAFLDILPLIPAQLRDDQRNKICGGRCTRGKLLFRAQFRYLPSPKSPIMLLRTKSATSLMPWATVRVILKPSWSVMRVNETR